MSLLERLLILIVAVLLVAALVPLIGHDTGRNAAPKPQVGAAGAGRFLWQ